MLTDVSTTFAIDTVSGSHLLSHVTANVNTSSRSQDFSDLDDLGQSNPGREGIVYNA